MEQYVPKIKLKKIGKPGAYYLRVPKDLVEELKLMDGSEASILVDRSKKTLCYQFGESLWQ